MEFGCWYSIYWNDCIVPGRVFPDNRRKMKPLREERFFHVENGEAVGQNKERFEYRVHFDINRLAGEGALRKARLFFIFPELISGGNGKGGLETCRPLFCLLCIILQKAAQGIRRRTV